MPTLLFVNKIDRAGASDERVLRAISARLTPAIVPVGSAHDLGTRAADFTPWGAADVAFKARLLEVLAENDDRIMATYVDDDAGLSYAALRQALAAQTKRALVHPVFFGSAITGAGVDSLMTGIAELLPAAEGDIHGPVSGSVFKIERGAVGEKIAYVRMLSGTVRTRDRLRFGPGVDGKVTAINVFDSGSAVERQCVSAGEIGKLAGLGEIQIGDRIGEAGAAAVHQFAPPTLESVVVPRDPADKEALRVALAQLAEQDPLINVRQDDIRQEFSVSLYGEVQSEVVQATLAGDFGIEVTFRETTTICIERPAGSGTAIESLGEAANPFLATVGLRIDPAPVDSGLDFRLQVGIRSVPMYVFKTVESFKNHMEQYARSTLEEGLSGWLVADCTVTLTDCDFSAPSTTAADFRKLTPLVLMRALEQAGTVVCEPVLRIRLEAPTGTIGAVLAALARVGAVAQAPTLEGELATIETVLPAARVQDLRRQLPALTGGEGVLESDFDGYEPVSGAPPIRRRTTADPLNRKEYLLDLGRRVAR